MRHVGAVTALLLLAAIAGCDGGKSGSDTRVLGGYGQHQAAQPSAPTLTDAQGRTIPAPPAPAGVPVRVVRTGDEAAAATWIADGQVVAATWTPAGWGAAAPLERIYGESGSVALASNGRNQAIAVWHHRVGNIHSLRFSRLENDAWSTPDVVPGALPQPPVVGAAADANAPQLQMDAQGNVVARWPSGFRANEVQVARYTPAGGWSGAVSESVASAKSASPAPPAASSAR